MNSNGILSLNQLRNLQMFYSQISTNAINNFQQIPLCTKKTAKINQQHIGDICIDDVESVYISSNKTVETVEDVIKVINSTKAIKYFENSKTLLLNNELDLFFDEYLGDDIQGNYYIYQDSSTDLLIAQQDLNNVIHSTINNSYHKNNQTFDLNLPYDLFDNILIRYDALAYDNNGKLINDYYSHNEILEIKDNIINNGLKTALPMYLQNDGSLLPVNNKCELQALILELLHVPSIPIKLTIYNNNKTIHNIFREYKINKQKIQELIQPNFILP